MLDRADSLMSVSPALALGYTDSLIPPAWVAATFSHSCSCTASMPRTSFGGVDYSVTSIRESAFADCTGLTTVSIPNTVTSIGRYAFIYCDNLTTLTIGSGIKANKTGCRFITGDAYAAAIEG